MDAYSQRKHPMSEAAQLMARGMQGFYRVLGLGMRVKGYIWGFYEGFYGGSIG